MAYLALYRRYRPTTFDNLIGQDHIVKTLVNQILTDKIGHAYLFTGTRGTGKTSCAKIFAKAINCTNSKNGSPCLECDSCISLNDPSNIDVVEIDAASNNGVNEIRELREKVQYPPVSCKYKVYIIDEVHMLTGAAFNALLKTLEEPPKYAVFILATTEVHKIPATILSRCMRFDFRLIPTERIAKLISDIYDQLNKPYDKDAVYAIASAGEGSIRDALSIADIALSYNTGKLTYEDVMEILGSSNFDVISEFIVGLLEGQSGNVLQTIDKLCDLGKSMGVLIKDITAFIRNLIVIKTCLEANKILNLSTTRFENLSKIAKNTNEERLIRCLQIFSEAEAQLRYSNHPRIIFETAAIKCARPDVDYNIDALITRIKTLEDKLANGDFSKKNIIKEEIKLQEKPLETTNKKRSVDKVDIDELKGILLNNVRKEGSEMLWNLLQTANVWINYSDIMIEAKSLSDKEYFERKETMQKIKNSLEDFDYVSINIVLGKSAQNQDKIDDEVDKIRKIFGEDIVIIKD